MSSVHCHCGEFLKMKTNMSPPAATARDTLANTMIEKVHRKEYVRRATNCAASLRNNKDSTGKGPLENTNCEER